MVICVHIPRFALTVAAAGAQTLAGRALALAPMAGAELRLGEVSGAAEAFGVSAGMVLGEALARCPELELVPADPLAVAEAWEGVVGALEGIGAAVEPAREGLAYFEADGLRGLHGSDTHTISAARRALARPVEDRGGPDTLLRAGRGAWHQRAPRQIVQTSGTELSGLPGRLTCSAFARTRLPLVEPLQRLGVRTLGELRKLGCDALADRFGEPGKLVIVWPAARTVRLCPGEWRSPWRSLWR